MTTDEFAKCMFFIKKLENKGEHGQGFDSDLGFLYRDEFDLLKKVLRHCYFERNK